MIFLGNIFTTSSYTLLINMPRIAQAGAFILLKYSLATKLFA